MASGSFGLMAVADSRNGEPDLVPDGLGWRFSPSEAPVSMGFSRIVERRDELTAEVHVQTTSKNPPEHVLRRRVNLLGTTTPKTLAHDLDLATDSAGWPWRKIIEQAFASVVEAHRAGDEVKLLGGRRSAPPSPVHVIPGLLMADRANTWFGPGGTGKSTAAVAACVASVLEAPFAGRPVKRCVPLYLDWEDEDDAFEEILWEVSRGYGLDESVRVHWQRMRSPLAGNIAFLSALIDRLGSTLVVIDSATRAMGSAGEHGTYESTAVAFAEAIRALGKVTTLIIDHVDGETVKGGGVAKKAYGSIHKLNFVRNAWSVTLDRDADDQTVAWTHAKVNRGRLERDSWGMRYERDPVLGGLTLVPVSASEVPLLAAAMTLSARIATGLGHLGVASVRGIAEEVLGSTDKKDVEKVRVTLKRDMGRHFRSYSDGSWSLRDWRPNTSSKSPNIRLINTAEEEPDEPPF